MIEVSTSRRVEVVDITARVAEAVPEVDRGVCTVYVPHTTAGVVVNENESRLLGDVEDALGQLVPADGEYGHDAVDDNADAHLRSMLLGEHAAIPVRGGELALGTWQSILFVECDGPRTRRVSATVTG